MSDGGNGVDGGGVDSSVDGGKKGNHIICQTIDLLSRVLEDDHLEITPKLYLSGLFYFSLHCLRRKQDQSKS